MAYGGVKMKRIAVVLGIIMSCAGASVAQISTGKSTVTNADLEKYRQKRLTDAREYRETYVAKGLPSPEEIERREEQRLKDTEALSAVLRAEWLERDRVTATIEAQRAASRSFYVPGNEVFPRDNTIYWYSYPAGYFGRHGSRRGVENRFYRSHGLSGYAAGGVWWPAPVGPKLFPMIGRKAFRTRRH